MPSAQVGQAQKCGLLVELSVRGLLALLLVVLAGRALALDPLRQPTQYVLDNWQVPEGLPETSVLAIARTPDGYLWVGTQEGLARFDGVRFTVFDTDKEPGIQNKVITALYVDRTGRLWVGTPTGLVMRENGHFTPLRKIAGLERAFVHAIAEGHAGRFWVGTESGLFEIGGGRTRSFNAASGLRDERVRALHEDADGVLWVGTAGVCDKCGDSPKLSASKWLIEHVI